MASLNSMHYWHFGLDNSLLWGAVLCIVEYLAETLASTYQMSVAPSSQLWQTKMSPGIGKCPLGDKNHLQLRTTTLDEYSQTCLPIRASEKLFKKTTNKQKQATLWNN